MTPTESTAYSNALRILTHEEFAARHPHPPSPVYVKIDRHSDTIVDRQKENAIDRKPSDNPPEATCTHSDDAADPMEVDRVPMGRTLRKIKEKVAKHLKRGANEKEMEIKQPHASSRRMYDPGLIAACHCGAEYETDYSASIETHTATSIDSAHQKSINILQEEWVDSSPGDWENYYYNPTMAAHTRDTMHTEEYDEDYEEEQAIENISTSIDRNSSTSIDAHLHQTSRKRASADIAYYPSIDTNVECAREGDYSIGSWADDRYHESYAVETAVRDPGADELHEGFTYEELLNMQRRDEADQ
ncbi:hypothetical protein F2Q68_00015613 [Brassica cretica]|uniref:Uncharacterized protein n=1 Tax=Brassica cretica TaxID=69181 RepID=A0A8S9HHM5_BRACR|nr:hypothetical protein F2Q68_00015613 [Brassica cretica]